jgi:hypothetical protein
MVERSVLFASRVSRVSSKGSRFICLLSRRHFAAFLKGAAYRFDCTSETKDRARKCETGMVE